MKTKNKPRTFDDYWASSNCIGPTWLLAEEFAGVMRMCRNSYNAGLLEGKKKRRRAIKK